MMAVSLLLISIAAVLHTVTPAQGWPPGRNSSSQISTLKNRLEQDSWEGNYTFFEGGERAAGASTFVEHIIVIYMQGDQLKADIDANGFQTARSIKCEVKVVGNRISFYFQSYREDNILKPYKSGQFLLALKKASVGGKARLLTYWGAYQPTFSRMRSGRVYFRKTI